MWIFDEYNYDKGNAENILVLPKFVEVYPTADVFLQDVEEMAQNMIMSDDVIDVTFSTKVYYLLLGKYALSTIGYDDPLMFRLGIMRIYSGRYSELSNITKLTNIIKNLDMDTVKLASQSISNTASNPNSDSNEEVLSYINNQDVNITKFPVIMAIQQQIGAINYGVISQFIDDFKSEFKTFFFRDMSTVYEGGY